MKNVLKFSLLLAAIPLMLTACEEFKEKQFRERIETSSGIEYVAGQCYQASKNDIVESVFIINAPTNPNKKENEEYIYDIIWNDQINLSYFSFTGGLKGKQVLSILKLGDNVIKVNIDHSIEDQEATFGYIKISHYAFKAINPDAKEAYLYAYVAIGDSSSMVAKPVDPENIAQSSSEINSTSQE